MSRIRRATVVFLLCNFLALSGALRAAGTVFVVGGVGGLDPIQACAPWMLPKAGVPHKIEVFTWTHGKCRLLRDLQDIRYLLAQADRLAVAVRAAQAREPGQPIYLLGHSAGTGVILAAAEKLPPASVERIILLSPAVSPTYDLRPALRATRLQVVSFNSTYDRFCLDLCTSVFGTVDRVYGPAAGLDGFQVPPDLDEEGRQLYQRLVQVPWHLEMVLKCTDGSHHGTCMPIFLAHMVAPWLMP
ncbi:MAG TPA: alpha/beta fold hydrolase [Gemmataceae bacterium]|jgi:pimeloyl-ACP methyl ester carboxylesterase